MDILQTYSTLNRPLVLGHRGSRQQKHYPENSIPAFTEAVELGADGVELDIRLTRDDQIVVSHDRNLKRLFGVEANVESIDLRTFQKYGFAKSPGDDAIFAPTLLQVFQAFHSKIFYNIEIKKQPKSYLVLAQELLNLIRDFNLENNVWLSSFDSNFLKSWQMTGSNIPCAYLFDRWNFFSKRKCRRDYSEWLHPSVSLVKKIDKIMLLGKPLFFWTVNTEENVKILTQKKVAGLITDNVPKVLKMLLKDA